MKRSLVVGGVLVLLTAFLMAGSVVNAANQGGKFISIDDDPVLGDAKAKVTIVEFDSRPSGALGKSVLSWNFLGDDFQ